MTDTPDLADLVGTGAAGGHDKALAVGGDADLLRCADENHRRQGACSFRADEHQGDR